MVTALGSLLIRLTYKLGIWLISEMSIDIDETKLARAIRALANERRVQVLDWLKTPLTHFPPQIHGDLVKDGVCGVFIAEKLGVSQPTASEHLRILVDAGLIRPKRIKQWAFYQRDERAIRAVKRAINKAF